MQNNSALETNPASQADRDDRRDAEAIVEWLVGYLGRLLGRPEEIDESAQFQRLGLDSAAIVGLVGDLGDWLGWKVDPTLAYDHPTVEALARELGARDRAGRT